VTKLEIHADIIEGEQYTNDLNTLRKEYKAKYGEYVPVTKWNDRQWIKTKL